MSEAPNNDFTPPPKIPENSPYAGLPHAQCDYSMPDREAQIARAEELHRTNQDFARVFQDECLLFLLTADREYFLARFTGERDADGYLIDVEGKPTPFLPSQNITAGLDRVSKVALEKWDAGLK